MDTTRVHPPAQASPDDTVEAHYASLERLECALCYEGFVFIGHLVDEDGIEVEVIEAVPCRRCADSR